MLFLEVASIAYLVLFECKISVSVSSKVVRKERKRYILLLKILLANKVLPRQITTLFVLNKTLSPLQFKAEIESKFASKPWRYYTFFLKIVWPLKLNFTLPMLYTCSFSPLGIVIETSIVFFLVKIDLSEIIWRLAAKSITQVIKGFDGSLFLAI